MRIISGQYKGHKLVSIKNSINLRPTSDKTKESIFNILNEKFYQNLNVLDLFCGSGNIGLEFISRNAKKVFFVDNNKKNLSILKKNIEKLKVPKENYQIFLQDSFNGIKYFFLKDIKFDVIFADPPYNKNFTQKIINFINKYDILNEQGILIIEHSYKEKITYENFILFKEKRYGDTKVIFLTKKIN